MEKFYLFKISSGVEETSFLDFIKGIFKDVNEVKFINNNTGYISSNLDVYLTLTDALNAFSADFSVSINFLITHKLKKDYFLLLDNASNYYQNSAFTLYDLALQMILNADYKLFYIFIDDFKNVPSYLIETSLMYLKSNLNASYTSKKIYIHRNTFNQRLDHFIKLTSLDIRDFYNASYFLLIENYIKIKK